MYAKFNLQREMINRVACGKIQNPSYEIHFHSHMEIYLVNSGAVEILVGNKKKVLHGGEISIAFSYDAHGYRTLEEASAEYLIIPRSYCGEFLREFDNKKALTSFIRDPDTYNTVFDAMEHLLQSSNELKKRGYIYIILGTILDKISMEDQERGGEEQFSAEMLIYMNDHFREELTLSDMASAFGYNPSYLSRNFKQTFGISFGRYLSILRLREFLLLSKEGGRSITQCALECGFGSTRSFYRIFRDEFGCTPKEYFERDYQLQ